MPKFNVRNTDIHYQSLGQPGGQAFFWGHGWGHSHENLLPLARALEASGHHTIVDFPGFGASPPPPEVWDTAAYADAIAEIIKAQNTGPVIWIGHSFGGRVGLQLASRHPELVKGMFLIAAAGLKRNRPLWQKIYFKLRIFTYKALKKFLPLEMLDKKFGASDYRKTSGVMRGVFVNVVNENQIDTATTVQCPVHLVYGANDTETPPEIGERLAHIIPNAKLTVLDGQDHYSVLSSGRHPVIGLLGKFIKQL